VVFLDSRILLVHLFICAQCFGFVGYLIVAVWCFCVRPITRRL